MGRIRSVSPDICLSETMAGLDAAHERTFVRLWTQCDDEGRCRDNVRLLKAALYPLHDDMSSERLDAELDDLATAGLLVRYTADGARYLQVRSWSEFQHPQRPTPSKIPAADGAPQTPRPVRESSASPPRPLPAGEGEGGEKEGKGGGKSAAARPRAESEEVTERKAVAREMTDRYWEWMQQTTGAPPAERHPALSAILADLLKHYSREQVGKALRGLRGYTPPKPVTKQTLLNEIQGLNGRRPAGPAEASEPASAARRDLTTAELERLDTMSGKDRTDTLKRWRAGEERIWPEEVTGAE